MKTNLKTLSELERPTRNLSLGWLAAFSIPFICAAILSIWSAALRAETDHILGEPSTAQGPNPYAEGDRILNGGAVAYPAEPSGSAVASQNPWKKIVFSAYSDYYEGRRAADGSRFSQKGYTVACNDVPLGTRLELNAKSGNVSTTLHVKVTDRLAKRFTGKRIDLSAQVWKLLSNGRKPGLLKGEWRRTK